MLQKPLITIIIGTRPEAIKLSPVIKTFKKNNFFETRVVLTGQHSQMVKQITDLFEIKIDKNLNLMRPSQSLTYLTSSTLKALEKDFGDCKPEIVLVQGDTTTAFSSALAAFYSNITIGHVEAGLRTDNILNPFPEEANRRLISQLTNLHFAPTVRAKENLIKSGINGEVYLTGNTVIDALLSVANKKEKISIPGYKSSNRKLILATLHRRENWGEKISEMCSAFRNLIDNNNNCELLIPLHKNPNVRNEIRSILENHERIYLTEPLGYHELITIMKECYFIMTDSGGIQEEAPSLGKPILVLRDTTERQEAIEVGSAKLVGTKFKTIYEAGQELLTNKRVYNAMSKPNNPFGDGHSSERIYKACKEYIISKKNQNNNFN